MQLRIHPEALSEALASARWYEEQRPGLGDDFLDIVSAALEVILKSPQIYQQWPGTEGEPFKIRRAVLDRFPYAIAFQIGGDNLHVLAVAHAKRRPLYWIGRASSE